MPDPFNSSRLKIERANKHISDIDSLLQSVINSDFYALSVEKDTDSGENLLHATINEGLPAEEYALIIGDALHNLRSALDFAYYETVILCGGTATRWTRFPIRDTREQLVSRLDSALKKKQISLLVHFLILNSVKPYQTGNWALWTLDDWNITDKHQLLIPVLKLVIVNHVSFEDEQHRLLTNLENQFFFGESGVALLKGARGLNVKVKNKGHAAADILFAHDMLKKIQAVIPTLRGIAEEVTKTIELFAGFFGDQEVFRAVEAEARRLGFTQ
jgi:hypothetical protein